MSLSPERLTILVADDHPIVRAGIIALIERESDLFVVGEAGSGQQTIERFHELRPDVALIDLKMPEGGGLGAVTSILSATPQARLIVLTTYCGEEEVYQAIRAGARGYLLKDAEPEDILGAIRAVSAGEFRFSPYAAKQLAERTQANELSPRERDVLVDMTQGMTNREIAEHLFIAESTVKYHINHILAKLGVTDRTQAVLTALRRGIAEIT
jgi:DNA-binding NarL/FixJ family response regulator